MPYRLFLSKVNLYRASGEVEFGSQLVFKKTFVRFFDILRKIAEERERRRPCRKLGHIFDLDVFAFPCRRRIILYLRQHLVVELRRGNLARIVLVNFCGGVKDIQDSLSVDYGREYYRNVIERGYP